jgi:hypothetical protein
MVEKLCCAPLSEEPDIRVKLCKANKEKSSECDSLIEKNVFGFWRTKGRNVGWYFGQIRDQSEDQASKNLVIFMRTKAGTQQAKLSYFKCICTIDTSHGSLDRFQAVLEHISDNRNRMDAERHLSSGHTVHLGETWSVHRGDIHKVVAVNVEGRIDFGLVTRVGDEHVEIIWLLRRSQVVPASEEHRRELEAVLLAPCELLLTAWRDKICIDSVDRLVRIAFLSPTQLPNARNNFFCRYICKCRRPKPGSAAAAAAAAAAKVVGRQQYVVEFDRQWTLELVATGQAGFDEDVAAAAEAVLQLGKVSLIALSRNLRRQRLFSFASIHIETLREGRGKSKG